MSGRAALVLAAAAAAVLAGCDPSSPTIVSPAHETPSADDGAVPIEIDLVDPLDPGSRLKITLLSGIDDRPIRVVSLDVPDRIQIVGASATGTLGPGDLAEGRNTLFVSLDRDGDGTPEYTGSSTFSWEPRLDIDAPCEFLDSTNCLTPYPSSFFTRPDPATDTRVRVAFPIEAMPVNVDDVPVDPTEFNRNDGFSPGQLLMLGVPGLDLDQTNEPPIHDIGASLHDADTAVVLIRASTGERQLLWAEVDQVPEPGAAPTLLIRPGVNLEDGERYVVGLRDLRDSAGDVLAPERAFAVYRDGIPTYREAIEERRPHMESLFETLAAAGVERDELYLAWDFNVMSKRSMSERMLEMRDDAFASLVGAAPVFHVDEVLPHSHSELFRQVLGRIEVPLYLTNDGLAGGSLNPAQEPGGPPLDPDRLPQRVLDDGQPAFYQANFLCIIPNSAVVETDTTLEAVPARPSLYGHGLLGQRTEARSSHNRAFANEYNFLSCATDWIGMAMDDIVHIATVIIPDFSKFSTMPDRIQQGFLNTLFLGRLLVHEDGFASHCAFQAVDWAPVEGDDCPQSGDPLFDGSDLFYDGNSEGAILGGGVAAFAQDWTRAVLGVPGMNYSTLLNRSVDFAVFSTLLENTYPDRFVQILGVAMVQMLWDRGETSGHANHLTHDPYPDTPAKKILLHVAYGDHQVAPVSAEVEARTIEASVHLPARATADPVEVEPYFAIPEISEYPFDGSALVVWDSGTPTPPLGNIPPAAGQDPHETPRRDPQAKLQKSEFMRTGGAVTDVCGGLACTAVDPP